MSSNPVKFKIEKTDRPYVLKIDGDWCKIVEENGIVQIQNGSVGLGFSAHPNIDKTGSVECMKALGRWGKHDRIKLAHGFYFNKTRVVITHKLDLLAYMIQTGQFDPVVFTADSEGCVSIPYPAKLPRYI
ncbi:hypothetical protein GCM10028806_34760 [Spirosoma terrae]|uniref:Uncharacterized protein n=1 Tax=Spirosoma terrae TaxID=1968276 RepID=A0A6L9L5W8_9BACT|nr:hypothetical protein [Spirosoma terrae]NDU95790.1 hypothetical protein [Spirosoma terrae]